MEISHLYNGGSGGIRTHASEETGAYECSLKIGNLPMKMK